MITDISVIYRFLHEKTQDKWVENAIINVPLLLIDHAHCEKKAASTAIALLYRYPDKLPLLHQLSRLAREELRHFEQVLALLSKRNITYTHLPPAPYAGALQHYVRQGEPQRIVDTLIIGALIEARSCERFYCLLPYLDPELRVFYEKLYQSEARHFEEYLTLAARYSPEDITERCRVLAVAESALLCGTSDEFRFHSAT